MSRPLNFNGDPIIRMRAYVRKSTERTLKARATLENKTVGQAIDDLARGRAIKGPENKKGPEIEVPEDLI